MKIKWLIPVLLTYLILPAAAAGTVTGEFQIYLGSFGSDQDQAFTRTIPEGMMVPAMDFKLAEEIKKTFNLKEIRLMTNPQVSVKVGESATFSWTPEDESVFHFKAYFMKMTVLSVENDTAHIRIAVRIDNEQETRSELFVRFGKPVTLASRLGDQLLFMLCNFWDGSENLIKPQLVKRVAPKYPPEMQKKGLSGKVVLNLTVDRTGKPTKIKVIESPDPGFDQAAVDAVRQWVFKPGSHNGQPVAMEMVIQIAFRLD